MTIDQLDAMIDAQFEYERRRIAAFGFGDSEPKNVYCSLNSEQLREVQNVTKIRARRHGEDKYAMAEVEYRGCVFYSMSGGAA